MHTILIRFCFLCFVCTSVQGCVLTPFIQTFNEMGVTKESRQKLLTDRLKDFHLAMQMGDPMLAAAFIGQPDPEDPNTDPNFQEVLIKEIRRRKKSEKVIDSKVDFVTLSPEGYKADVEVLVQYYEIPYYIVQERSEKEVWKFSTTGGWAIVAWEIGEGENA